MNVKGKIINFRSYLFESKWNLLFDIYDSILKISYISLMKVYLNHIKIQFKERNPLINSVCIYHYKKFVLLWRFFFTECKNRRYMLHIVVFFGIAAIGIVFCGILQWQDIKPPQYICFSSGNLDIVALQKPAAINISFYADTLVVVKKNIAICEL